VALYILGRGPQLINICRARKRSLCIEPVNEALGDGIELRYCGTGRLSFVAGGYWLAIFPRVFQHRPAFCYPHPRSSPSHRI